MAANLDAVIAVNRFGLGARPGELAQAKSDPRGWLLTQIKGERSVPESVAKLPSGAEVFKSYVGADEACLGQDRPQADASGARERRSHSAQASMPCAADSATDCFVRGVIYRHPCRRSAAGRARRVFTAIAAGILAILGPASRQEFRRRRDRGGQPPSRVLSRP